MKHLKINNCPFSSFTMNYYAETYMRLYWHRLSFDKVCWKNLAKAIIRIAKENWFALADIDYKQVVLWLAYKKFRRTLKSEDWNEWQELRLFYR